jgi:putative ATP-binding cassette transporter
MRYNKRLTWFTAFYGQTAGAFAQVQGPLSWFVAVWPALAEWKATIDRLTTFGETMEATREATAAASHYTIERGDDPVLRLKDVAVALPDAPLLGRFRTSVVRDGFFDEDGELWTEDGTLVAQSRQLGLLLPTGA